MTDKDALYARIDEMLRLPPDWDGFGTGPISHGVHKISKRLIQYLPDDGVRGVRVLVGVNTAGSVAVDIDMGSRKIEMTVTPGGIIFWDEMIAGMDVGSGTFILSKKKLSDIIQE